MGRKERLAAMVAALATVWLAGAAPARADDEDEARDACRELAQRADWRDIDTDVRRENDNRIVVRVRGERNGDNRERICVYNTRTNDADFRDDDGGRRDEVEEARDACRRIAQNRDWDNVDTDVRREGDDRIVIRVRGEREDRGDRERRCIYNTRTNEARFEDQPRNR